MRSITKKLCLTGGLLLLFQLLSFVPTPFISKSTFSLFTFNQFAGLGQYAFTHFTLMATGVSSYISASIFLQMLQHVSKTFFALSRNPGGNVKMKRLTIGLGMIVSFISSMALTYVQHRSLGVLGDKNLFVYLPLIGLYHAMGTGLAIWIGETITEKGYGNGMTFLILMGMLGNIPETISVLKTDPKWYWAVLLIVCVLLVVVLVEGSFLELPMVNAKSAIRGGAVMESVFPIKVNMNGVMPVILSGSIIQIGALGLDFLAGIESVKPYLEWTKTLTPYQSYLYPLIMCILVFVMGHLYNTINFDPDEIADNFQRSETLLTGVAPGKATARYLEKVSKKLTNLSIVYIVLVVLVPTLITSIANIYTGAFTATSMMILVAASSEFFLQLENDWKVRKLLTRKFF